MNRVVVLLLILYLLIPLPVQPAATSAMEPGIGTEPVAYIEDPLPLDARSYALMLMERADRDHDGVSDGLEDSSGAVRVIVWFNSRTAVHGGGGELARGLGLATAIVESYGGRVYAGPWLYALPGFAAEVDAGLLHVLGGRLMGLDVDGDGLGDRVLISPDGRVEAFNLWSARQMAVRPQVWNGLGYTGSRVTVAVLDSGVDGGNEAFEGKIVYWGDYSGDPDGVKRPEPYDDNSHGTHVAGSVAGILNALDPEGRLVFVYGLSELYIPDAYSGLWITFGLPSLAYLVNSTGTIEVEVKWKGDPDGALTGIALGYCGWTLYPACNPQVVATRDTFAPDTWYTLTYGVSSESQYGFYVLMMRGQGSFAMLPVIHLPVASPGDGFPMLAGTAPGATIAAAKVLDFSGSGADSWIISAINDIVAARTRVNPPVYIVSMSLGGTYSEALDQAVTNAASSGLLFVVAAGNDGPDQNYAGTGSPSSNPYALTVAALDGFNNITEYSSKGGESTSLPTVAKPDIAAPGGGAYVQILSADTSWHDDTSNFYATLTGQAVEDVDWGDAVNKATRGYDDSTPMQGTSMATPHVSGAAALVVEALLDSGVQWSWRSSETAMLVKNLLLISTYETYPLTRVNAPAESPGLERGGKDPHEGYGALDAQAAVNIAWSLGQGRQLEPGDVVEYTLRHGILYNSDLVDRWRWPFGPSVWASAFTLPYSTIRLSNGSSLPASYTLTLRPAPGQPQGMDLDLYVYRLHGDQYGEPIILAKSTGPGASESLTLVPRSPGQAIVAVKRATEASPGGKWILSLGPGVTVTGQSPEGTWTPGEAWDGLAVEVTILSPRSAPTALLEVYDNTSGVSIYRERVTLSQAQGGTGATVTLTLPRGLAGHQLLFIVETRDASGGRVSGPHVASVVVNPTEGGGETGPQPGAWLEVKPQPTPPVDLYLRAGGLAPGAEAQVYLVHPNGASEQLATLPVSASGEAWGLVGLPRTLAPGSYTIALYQSGSRVAEAQVTVGQASVVVDRAEASPGDVVRIVATGLGAGYGHVYHLRVAGLTLATLTPDPSGSAETTITVPPLPRGVYTIELVYPGTPQDSDRTYYRGPHVVASTTIRVVGGLATLEDLEELRRGLEARISTLELAVSDLNESITSLVASVSSLQDTLATLADDMELLQSNISSLAGRVDNLEEALAQRIEALEARAQATSEALGRLDQRLTSLEAEAARLNATITSLDTSLQEARARIASLGERLDNLTISLKTLQGTVRGITATLAQLRATLDRVTGEDLPSLEARLDLLQTTLNGVDQRLTQQQATLQHVQQALEDAADRLDTLEEKTGNLEAGLQDTSQALASTRTLATAALVLAIIAIALLAITQIRARK